MLLPQLRDDGSARAVAQVVNECAAAVGQANRLLAEYQRVRRWVIWPDTDFPRTPTGKPRLAAIAARIPELLSQGKEGLPAANFLAGLPVILAGRRIARITFFPG